MANHKHLFIVFIIGYVLTFIFITLLQVAKDQLFIPLLIFMHMGILLLIFSKKMFIKQNLFIKPYYHKIYLLLALYLPILGYKLTTKILKIDYQKEIVIIITYILTGFCIIVSSYVSIQFYKKIIKK